MSLAIALEQIQRPTWWVFENQKKRGPTPVKILAVQEKRAQILDYIRKAGRKVSTRELRDQFGLTNSAALSAMRQFLEEGHVRQFKPRHDFSLWEAV